MWSTLPLSDNQTVFFSRTSADDRKELPASEYKTLTVDKNCELKDFLQSENSGCVYYEFTREKEDIVDKQIIFKDRVRHTTWHTCTI